MHESLACTLVYLTALFLQVSFLHCFLQCLISNLFSHVLFLQLCYLDTLLIDTNTTNSPPSQLHTNGFDILISHIHTNGIEPSTWQTGANVLTHLKSPNIFMAVCCINKGL
jgi:hypothetical protein